MTATERLARTDGGRLVPEADPAGRTLAYCVGDTLTAADAAMLRPPAAKQAEPERTKEIPVPRNKARKKATKK